MPLDNALEKIKQGITDDSDNLFDGLVQAGAVFSPIFATFEVARAVVSAADTRHRMVTAIHALADELSWMQESLPSNAEEALKSRWFRRAVRTLLDEAAREVDVDRAEMLALVAAHGCFADGSNVHRRQDLASYIKDLQQLGTEDVELLKMICEAHKDVVKNAPNLNDVNMWTNGYGTLKGMADKRNLHPDDCLSSGKRLEGFGLTVYMENSGVIHQGELRFRPTLRGLYMVSLLTQAEASMAARRQQQAASQQHTQNTSPNV